ncbi:MAG: hypothetical protein ACI4I6_09525 [Hominimerdicola sp.]
MINVEPIVFTAIYKAVKEKYPNASLTSIPLNMPKEFPCVSVVEIDNYTYTPSQDDENQEHHANVTYEINVYTDKEDTNKEEAKEIMGIVDNEMQNMKFTRMSMLPTPNLDRTKYRITARYRAVVSEPTIIDGEEKYFIYRK